MNGFWSFVSEGRRPFYKDCKKIAGRLRMDTQGSLKRIAVVLAVVAEYHFPTVSRLSIIHSDSNKSGTTLWFSEEERRRIEQENNTYLLDARRVFVWMS